MITYIDYYIVTWNIHVKDDNKARRYKEVSSQDHLDHNVFQQHRIIKSRFELTQGILLFYFVIFCNRFLPGSF